MAPSLQIPGLRRRSKHVPGRPARIWLAAVGFLGATLISMHADTAGAMSGGGSHLRSRDVPAGRPLFDSPLKLAIDDRGYIYVVEVLANRVDELTPGGREIARWGTHGSAPGQFSKPTSIAVDRSRHIYVMDGENNRIQVFTSSGRFLRQWGSGGIGRGQFFGMFSGLAVDANGQVYVADFTNSRVEVFTSSGRFLAQWGRFGTAPGELNAPIDIVVRGKDVYVVDHRNDRVQEFSRSGRPLFHWAGLNQPEGLAVDAGGNIYVGADTILKLSSRGRRLASWGKRGGIGPGLFSDSGLGLALDRSGDLYVADGLNRDIQKFSPTGQVLALWR